MKFKLIFILFSVFLLSCQEKNNEPLVQGDGVPAPVSNVQVENLPGAAKISYSLPDDQTLLYVLAEYVSTQGVKRTVKSSVYKNFVILDGFATTDEYDVQLYTVNRSENRSEPSTVHIQPLTAPIHTTFETVDVFETFGGVAVNFTNKEEAEYVFHTLYKDAAGQWVSHDRLYSSAQETAYSVRGFEPVPTEFAFYFTDKWKNNSDTLVKTMTPLYEEEMDKSLWKNAELLDDYYRPRYSPLYQLWTPGATAYFFQYHLDPELKLPNWFTIDLGRAYRFGRMKLNQVNHNNTWRYSSCSPRKFAIYGSNKASIDWNDWDLLGEFESIKPSGLPVGQLSAEDLRVNLEGEDYDFPVSAKSYRYIRYVNIQTWGGGASMCALEFTFWGQAVN